VKFDKKTKIDCNIGKPRRAKSPVKKLFSNPMFKSFKLQNITPIIQSEEKVQSFNKYKETQKPKFDKFQFNIEN